MIDGASEEDKEHEKTCTGDEDEGDQAEYGSYEVTSMSVRSD